MSETVSIGITINTQEVSVTASPVTNEISVTVTGPEQQTVLVEIVQGSAGSGVLPGPGFQLVGTELRYDIASLTRG
jgi:hypothetical protein